MKKIVLSIAAFAITFGATSIRADGIDNTKVEFTGLKYGLGFALAGKHTKKSSVKKDDGTYFGNTGYLTKGEYNHAYGFHGKALLEKVVNYDGILIGGELFAAYDFFNPKHQSTRTLILADNPQLNKNNSPDTLTTRSKKTFSAGAIMKMGPFKESAWVHGNLGIDVAGFANELRADNYKRDTGEAQRLAAEATGGDYTLLPNNASSSESDTRLGLIFGAGIDVKLNSIIIAFDANYHHYFGGKSVVLQAVKTDGSGTIDLDKVRFRNRSLNFNFTVKMPI